MLGGGGGIEGTELVGGLIAGGFSVGEGIAGDCGMLGMTGL
jgi:hypothetical protein